VLQHLPVLSPYGHICTTIAYLLRLRNPPWAISAIHALIRRAGCGGLDGLVSAPGVVSYGSFPTSTWKRFGDVPGENVGWPARAGCPGWCAAPWYA